jgi:hypothetical protein
MTGMVDLGIPLHRRERLRLEEVAGGVGLEQAKTIEAQRREKDERGEDGEETDSRSAHRPGSTVIAR